MTEINERFVLGSWIQDMLDQGYKEDKIALMHNAGGAKSCGKGTNSKGVPYDSCSYVKLVIAKLKQ